MWIYSKYGFISCIKKADQIVVRSREKKIFSDLNYIGRLITTRDSDYPYRVVMTLDEFKKVLIGLADDLDYDNFKESVKKKKNYYHLLMQIWWMTKYKG